MHHLSRIIAIPNRGIRDHGRDEKEQAKQPYMYVGVIKTNGAVAGGYISA